MGAGTSGRAVLEGGSELIKGPDHMSRKGEIERLRESFNQRMCLRLEEHKMIASRHAREREEVIGKDNIASNGG